jgi:uncharacterized flavoprotein (TIGR03862 family)
LATPVSSSSLRLQDGAHPPPIVVVGAGPAGLMAAERIAAAGLSAEVFDSMPSAGRKFLLAGRGGLNITHSEPINPFLSRYRERRPQLTPWLETFGPQALRDWVHALGVDTFVGSSGRVFPKEMKAAPLLRAWLHRLRQQGVRFRTRHRWVGFDLDATAEAGLSEPSTEARPKALRPDSPPVTLRFDSPSGPITAAAQAVVLALGGASWQRLGSDGAWFEILQALEVPLSPLRPSNCGFEVGALPGRSTPGWSPHFAGRFAGLPLKTVAACLGPAPASPRGWRTGDFVITDTGVEGTLIYALSAELRDALDSQGAVELLVDLNPGRSHERLAAELARPRKGSSLANHLRARAGLEGVKAGLLREVLGPAVLSELSGDPVRLAGAIKAVALPLIATRPLDEAISTAGGVRFEALDEQSMLRKLPGVFCAGEMLDWEAPTGGYLLNACLASGWVAGEAAARFAASPAGA